MMSTDHSEAWETLQMNTSDIRKVPLDSIYIDQRFQRALGEHRKNAIKSEYHPQGIGLLVVAHVNGQDGYACIDGQTRLVALRELRDEGAVVPTDVTAEVYENLTTEEAALLFRLRNFQTAVPVREQHRIALTEGDPTMTEVLRQVEMAGFTLFSNNGQSATMPYVDVAKRLLRWGRKYGRDELLAEALTVQANAFGTEIGAVDKVVVQATANILRKNAHIDEDQFTEQLRSTGVQRILGEAEVIRQGPFGVRLATATEMFLVNQYNTFKGVEKIRH